MNKIFIDNEEVLCDSSYKIEEELKNPSSVILDKVYPKRWKGTNKLLTEFYFPKDYSKCLIYDEKTLLPKGYTQVDYIESSGTQYIDTGYIPTIYDSIETKFSTTNSPSDTNLYGSRKNNTGKEDYTIWINTSTNKGIAVHFPISATERKDTGWFYKNNIIDNSLILKVTPEACYVNNEKLYTFSDVRTEYDGTYTAYLFCRNDVGISRAKAKIKLYYFKLWNGENLVRDFIPCYRNSDNEIGLYDLVNNVFYTNQGTGTFTYGQVQETIISTLLFSGIVKNSGNMVLNPRKPHYCSLQILDYSTLLSESDTLDYVINNKTIPEAIEQVIDSISSYGFVIGNINIKDTTSIIGAYSTLDKTPYDVFEYLSEISQSVWFTRMIDENTIAIDFYDVDYLPQNDDIEYTREYFNENKINNIEYDYSTNDYRNKQIIKSSQVYGNVDYVETIIANGYDKTFSTSSNIGFINSITVNGIEKTIGTEIDKGIGIEADFYYEAGKNTFENNENDFYSAGTQITINYTPLIKGRELISNNSEILRINNQTQRKGTITRYENRDDILSADELNKVAQSYLKTYSNSEIVLKVNSSSDFLTLGSKIFFNAPLDDLKKEYLVKKKTTYIKQAGEFSLINYEYELSSTFNLNNEINYFDNQRRKSEGNISSGEYITRNVDIEETANIIWDNLTITEVTPTGDNVLNSPLNSPFIQ